jgi:hypothetical protein
MENQGSEESILGRTTLLGRGFFGRSSETRRLGKGISNCVDKGCKKRAFFSKICVFFHGF